MNKNETLQIKGVAIILMFIHHIIGCGSFLLSPETECVVFGGDYSCNIAESFRFCIALFSFVSGYGIYKSNTTIKKNIFRIFKFLISYWCMLIVPIAYLLFTHRLNLSYLPINLFALIHDDEMLYLSFSWYVKVYLEFLLIVPFVIKLSKKINNIFIETFLFIILPALVAHLLPESEEAYTSIIVNCLSSIRLLLTWYAPFHVGILFSRYDLLKNSYFKTGINKILVVILSFSGMALSIFFRYRFMFSDYTDSIALITFIVSFKFLLNNISVNIISKQLVFLGKNSFQYWLFSGMFFLNTIELQKYLYWPKYAILIVIWAFIILTPFAVLFNKISSLISSKIFNCISKQQKKGVKA